MRNHKHNSMINHCFPEQEGTWAGPAFRKGEEIVSRAQLLHGLKAFGGWREMEAQMGPPHIHLPAP